MFSILFYQIASFVLAAALIPIAFRTLGSDNFAFISLGNSILALVTAIFVGPTLHAVGRFYNRDIHGAVPFLRSILVFTIPCAITLLTALNISSYFGFKWDAGLLVILIFVVLADAVRETAISYLNITEKHHVYGLTLNVNLVSRLALLSASLYLSSIGNLAPLLYYAMMLFSSIVAISFAVKYSDFKLLKIFEFGKDSRGRLLKEKELSFAIGFALVNVLNWSQNWLDKWLLSYHLDIVLSEQVGSYIAAGQIINAPFQLILSVFFAYYGPKLYYALNAGKSLHSDAKVILHTLYRPSAAFALIALCGFLGSIPLSWPVCSIILGSAFHIEPMTLLIISAYSAVNSFAGLLAYYIQTLKLFRSFFGIQVATTLTLFIIFSPLIKANGLTGAAIAMLASSILRLILMFFLLKRNA